MSKPVETSRNQLKPVAGTGSGGVCGGLCRGQFFQSRGGSGGQSARRTSDSRRNPQNKWDPCGAKQYRSCIFIALPNFRQGPRNAVIFASSSSPSRDGRTDFSAKSDMLLHFRIFLTDMAVYSMLPYGPQLLTLVIGYSTLVVWFGHESYQICDSVGPVGARWVQTG